MITWLLMNTLTAALFAGLVWAVIKVTKPAPGIRHALWLIVLLKLVSPVELFWSVPVVISPAVKSETIKSAPQSTVTPETPVYGLISEELIEVTTGEKLENPLDIKAGQTVVENLAVMPTAEAGSTAVPADAPQHWRIWLLFVWLAGGVFTISRLTRDTYRFGRFAKLSKKAPQSLCDEVALVAGRMDLRTPAVRMLAGLASPVMWCVGKPVLLWPADLDKQVTGEGRRAVIAHELAHLRRRDHWVRWLEMVVAVVHWWNPVFWLARQNLRADAELACDQWATTQADRRTYAEALLAVCMFQPRRRPAAAVGVLGEGKREMQERLTQIMKMSSPSRAAFVAKLCVVLFGLASIPALTLGQAPAPEEKVEINFLDDEIAFLIENLDLESQEQLTGDEELFLIQNRLVELQRKYETLVEQMKRTDKRVDVKATLKIEEDAVWSKLAEARKAAEIAQSRQKEDRVAEFTKRYSETLSKAVYENNKTAAKAIADHNYHVQSTLKAGTNGVKVIGPDGKEMTGVTVMIDPAMNAQIFRPTTVAVPPGQATTQYGYANPVASPKVGQTLPPEMQQCSKCHWPTPNFDAKANCSFLLGRLSERERLFPANTAAGNVAPAIPAPGITTLSRATYQLPKGQADKIATLLNGMKNAAIEAKADHDMLIVTTTAEAQQVIGNFVRLMGDPNAAKALRLSGITGNANVGSGVDAQKTVDVFEKIGFDFKTLPDAKSTTTSK